MTTSLVRTRYGAEADLAAVTAMHDRCSARSLRSRFHSPLPRVRTGMARRLLRPADGWSRVAELGPRVVGLACAGPLSAEELEVGLLVEDAHQGRGIGTRLLREVAAEAGRRGYRTLSCLTEPGNGAVLEVVRKAALPATRTRGDGLLCIAIHLDATGAALPRPAA